MNYEQRKQIISSWLFDTLKRYEAPSHFDDAASRQEMILMVEDMNSELPLLNEGSTKLLLEKTGQYVRKNHTSRPNGSGGKEQPCQVERKHPRCPAQVLCEVPGD